MNLPLYTLKVYIREADSEGAINDLLPQFQWVVPLSADIPPLAPTNIKTVQKAIRETVPLGLFAYYLF